jgi:hypothetical protein
MEMVRGSGPLWAGCSLSFGLPTPSSAANVCSCPSLPLVSNGLLISGLLSASEEYPAMEQREFIGAVGYPTLTIEMCQHT